QRGAHGHLSLSRGRARELEVGHVRAGDEQDKRDRAQQHEQRSLHISDDLLVQADQRQNILAVAAPLTLTTTFAGAAPRPGTVAPSLRRFAWLNTLRDCSQFG